MPKTTVFQAGCVELAEVGAFASIPYRLHLFINDRLPQRDDDATDYVLYENVAPGFIELGAFTGPVADELTLGARWFWPQQTWTLGNVIPFTAIYGVLWKKPSGVAFAATRFDAPVVHAENGQQVVFAPYLRLFSRF